MKTLGRLAGLVVIAGVLLLAYRHFFPNEERAIRQLLARLAATASIPANRSPASAMLALDRLSGFFSRDVEVVVDVPAEGRHTFNDRAELMQAFQAAWANARSVKVEFLDVNVTLDGAGQTATAELTAKATRTGDRDFFVQELKLELRKQEGDWRITRAETVRTLEK